MQPRRAHAQEECPAGRAVRSDGQHWGEPARGSGGRACSCKLCRDSGTAESPWLLLDALTKAWRTQSQFPGTKGGLKN